MIPNGGVKFILSCYYEINILVLILLNTFENQEISIGGGAIWEQLADL